MQCHFCVNLLVSVFGHTVHWNVLLPDIQHSPFTCGALECFTARHTTFTLYLWCFGMFYCQTYNIHLVPVVLWNGLLPYIQHSPFTCGALECFTAIHTTFTLYLWCGMFLHSLFLFFVCSPDPAKIYCDMQHRVSKVLTNCTLDDNVQHIYRMCTLTVNHVWNI